MTAPVLVAGGGLAGAAAAAELARNGVAVTLLERETQPVHKICGEFLSQEAQSYLARLGMDLAQFAVAPISRLRLVRGNRCVEAALPFQGIGLSRHRLDEALLLHAQSSGARVLRGRNIRSLDGAKLLLQVENEGELAPEILLLATGKHELRGGKRLDPPGNDLIGFKMHFRLNAAAQAALTQYIELIFFSGGYAGLQMIEDGAANLCLLVQRETFTRCGGTWPGLLEQLRRSSAHLSKALEGAVELLPQPVTIFRVPYGFMHAPQQQDSSRIFRLGDQACVIHSFTGDGMSIALHSAALAVRAILRGDDAAAYHRRLASDVRGQMRRANALYGLLTGPRSQPVLFATAKIFPTTLKWAAAATRVPLQARL